MEFVDETTIHVRSGNGGHGCVAFRRERNVPLGGPSGGDGGDGGSVFLVATENADTLLPLARTREYSARDGEGGRGNFRHGKNGADVATTVPVGTMVWEKERLVADLSENGRRVMVARGGRGGRGNAHFAGPENRSPDEWTKGTPGQSRKLRLELRLIADVGLLGFPNAGKSTLLSRFSAARPKIADYPFTTLQPQLGIVSDGGGHELVMADIPGIIAGAAGGAGMGLAFLRHVERCRFLLHLVDLVPVDGADPVERYRTLRNELAAYSPALAARPELVVGTKLDLPGADESLARFSRKLRLSALGISAVVGTGLEALRRELFRWVRDNSRPPAPEENPAPPASVAPVEANPGEAISAEEEWAMDADAFPSGADGEAPDEPESARPLPKNVGRPRHHRRRRR